MSFHPFRFDFEDDRKSGSIDFDLSLRAFEVETRSFLESEKDLIHGLTSMLQVREAIELLDIPTYNPLTGRKEIPSGGLTFGPASVVKVPWVEIKPIEPYDVRLIGSPVSLLSFYGTCQHELVHQMQIFHKSMFNAYVQSERAINRFINIIRKGKDERILRELLIKLTEESKTEESKRFNPLNIEEDNIEEDKRCLLESKGLDVHLAMLTHVCVINNEELKEIIISRIKDEELKKLRIAFVKNVYESKYHKQAFKLFYSVLDISDKVSLGLGLLFDYLSYFSDYGASNLFKLFKRIENDHNILKYLKELLDFFAFRNGEESGTGPTISNVLAKVYDEIGTGPISNELAKYKDLKGERLSFSSYRKNILGEINGVLEKLDGFSKKRVKMLKEIIERSGKPSQCLDEISKSACLILKDKESSCYYPVAYYICIYPDYFSLMLSFYSDLHICTSILKAAKEAFIKGEGPWKAMERAIVCPYRNAPLMGCREKSKCEHEKPWLDAVVER
jgi:hypothetical protein